MKILIIDDDPFFSMLFEKSITNLKANVDVKMFQNGKLGLDYINEHGLPNIIFLDLNMPIMDGFIFLQNMGKRTDLSKTRIFMISSVIDPSDKEDIEDIGIIEALIIKPVEPSVLEDILNNKKIVSQ